ncbi:FAD-dependent oxidoreductase domain-containing protein 1 [Manduca sexta]|uniref:FAD dependent oxidoreductase domain-containing protein n=1 Tax=Manduca sexta TaxID=7130 RepID=A0A921YVX4_MANSE|nr:FAD-dependent oxidoreductase domain-containing protein 1 [Manduca sexta]KAG6446280.1 hypothetical protein O3G_MSEX004377 [Manduca sexta]KAG6446281.1 hypothetical protein O3G_MSEX004377 [Manduca sexta]
MNMYCRIIKQTKSLLYLRPYSTKNPFSKTWNTISQDIPYFFKLREEEIVYPEHADIVIIGGGLIGVSTAYWLNTRAGEGISVVVLEKDFSYSEMQKKFKYGTLTQHFSLPENILLSQHSAEFLRNIKQNVNNNVDIQYFPTGSLVLASEQYADKLEHNVAIQKEHGLRNELLSPNELKSKFPWLNVSDVKLGCMGVESEGIYNSWELLKGLIHKTKELGTTYVNAEVVGFEMEKQRDVLMEGIPPGSFERIIRVIYKTPNNEEHKIKFSGCILAGGAYSSDIAKLAKVGTGDGMLAIPLPIDKREHGSYIIKGKAAETGLSTPLVNDSSGFWLRRNGLDNNLLCGQLPSINPEHQNEIDIDTIKCSLQNRFSNYENCEIQQHITETYDCNVYDDSGILGPHPYHNNLYIATGFGKYGCQHAPGIGRAIAELIIDSQFTTIDLTRLGFDRLLVDEPVIEFNVY